jgi:hypothetical protein
MDEEMNEGQEVSSVQAQPEQQESALVRQWQSKVKSAKGHWKKVFDQMKLDMRLARGEDPDWPKGNYYANLILRHVTNRVSSLYARNPKVEAKMRERLLNTVWDGSLVTLQQAYGIKQQAQQMTQMGMQAMMGAMGGLQAGQQLMQLGAMDPAVMAALPDAEAIIADYEQGQQYKTLLRRMGKTLEILYNYYMDEQHPSFKSQAKQLVRRTVTCGVGYVKLGFQRAYEPSPDTAARIADVTDRIAHVERLKRELDEGECCCGDLDAKREELASALAGLQKEEQVAREGITFSFPHSNRIIPDTRTTDLEGFVGAGWLAEEFFFTPEEVEEIYGVKIGSQFTAHQVNSNSDGEDTPSSGLVDANGDTIPHSSSKKDGMVCVWEVYDKKTGNSFTIADGHKGWLKAPDLPNIEIEQFFPYFTLAFNKTEDPDHPYPPSDVSLLIHPQREYNRSRHALREHRIANRPKYVTPAGALEDEDLESLGNLPAHHIIKIAALGQGMTAEQMVQAVKHAGIDPAIYDTSFVFDDITRTVGAPEAQTFGATGNGTATEAGIAESGRISTVQSNVDDLDDMLTRLARAGGQVLLKEVSVEEAKRIAGPGAVWPEFTRQQRQEEIFLQIQAGSSGRPNKTLEIANFERMAPILQATPGMNPEWFLREAVRRMDDTLDTADAFSPGMPSMIALNGLKGDATTLFANHPALGGAGMATGNPTSQVGSAQRAPTAQGPANGMNPAPAM